MSFSWNKNTLFQDFSAEAIVRKIEAKADTEAIRLEAYMKTTRPWTDRSSQAKRTLSGESERKGDAVVITLAHGVDYGEWLETRWGERYAVIKPTLATQSAKVMQSMAGLLDFL